MAHEESYELIWWIFSCQSNFSPIFNYLDPDTQHWFSQNRNFRNTKLVWKPYLYCIPVPYTEERSKLLAFLSFYERKLAEVLLFWCKISEVTIK